MPKLAWGIAGVLTTLLVVAILGYTTYEKSRELDQTQAALNELRTAADKTQAEKEQAQTEARALKDKLAESQSRIGELQKENEHVVQSHKSLEDEMRAALESKDVTISQLQGKLTVNILDRVLFDSGEAELRPDGEGVLRKIAAILSQHPQLKIHVIGHTDNVPIRKRFASNWELSTARAIAAVRFLSEKARVDPRRLGAVGYGEFRPVADNATAEGRARNRRIAITILSEELAGADTVPNVKAKPLGVAPLPIPVTNAPPEPPDLPSAGATHPPED